MQMGFRIKNDPVVSSGRHSAIALRAGRCRTRKHSTKSSGIPGLSTINYNQSRQTRPAHQYQLRCSTRWPRGFFLDLCWRAYQVCYVTNCRSASLIAGKPLILRIAFQIRMRHVRNSTTQTPKASLLPQALFAFDAS